MSIHVARTEIRNAYRISMENPLGKRHINETEVDVIRSRVKLVTEFDNRGFELPDSICALIFFPLVTHYVSADF
jgi:hypothetical protein